MEISKNFFKITHFNSRKKLTLIDLYYKELTAIPQSPFLAALLFDIFQKGHWFNATIEDDLITAVKLIPREKQRAVELKSLALRGGSVLPPPDLDNFKDDDPELADSKGEKD